MSVHTAAVFAVILTSASVMGQTITVAGADPNAGLKFTTNASAVTLPVYLELDKDKVTGLQVMIDSFLAPDSTLVPVTVTMNGKPASEAIDVSQQERPRVDFKVTLPVAGDYKSHLTLVYAGKRQKSIPLTVTRQRNALSIQIEGLNTVPVERWFNAPDATANFIIRESSGQAVTLHWPKLVGFALKDGDKRRQAVYKSHTFEVTNKNNAIHVPAGDSAGAKLTVCGIGDPGEYSGKVRVSSADTIPVDAEVTILVKDNWFVAFLFILAGVAISFLIRRYTKEARPKLIALRNLSDIRSELHNVRTNAGEIKEVETTLFDGLSAQIATLDRDLTRGATADSGVAALKELQNKVAFLPAWLTVGRKLRNVTPPSLVATPRAAWEAMADSYFLKRAAGDAPAAALTKITADIDAAVKSDLIDRIEAFRKLAETHKASNPQIDANVLQVLVKADGSAKNDRLPEATADFQSARLAYARIMAGELDKALIGPAPPGFQPADWSDLGQRLTQPIKDVQKETDPDTALSLFETANIAYTEAVIGAMKTAIADTARSLSGGIVRADEAKSLQTKLDGASDALNSGEAALRAGNTDGARVAYEKASGALGEVNAAISRAGGAPMSAGMAAAVPSLASVPEAGGMQTTEAVPDSQLRQMSLSDRIQLRIDALDLWFNLAILLIATVVGLNVLWASDPVWGGWKAYITALLWGLGLQQAGGATLDGLSAVTKKVTE